MIRKTLIVFIPMILISCVQPLPNEPNSPGNGSPEIQSIVVDPVFIRVGTTANITVEAIDPEGDPLNYKWSVALGDIIGSGSQIKYTAAYCCVGVNTINLVIEDSKGAKISESINIEVNP